MAATRSRRTKAEIIAEVLGATAEDELDAVVSWLGGRLLQRRTGLGWKSLRDLPPPADEPGLTVPEVARAFAALADLAGSGSRAARAVAVAGLFGRATADEQRWLRGLVTGEVRQGALDALVQEGIARASGHPVAAVRRAAMLGGSTVGVARAALTGGAGALAEFRLEVGRPILPMLAASQPETDSAFERLGTVPVIVDQKLDGIRLQAHKDGDRVLLVTRTLEDVTARLPEVADVVRALPAGRVVLDGEVLAIGPEGRPRPFQETAARTASGSGVAVTPYFFDVLLVDDEDLLEQPLAERARRLVGLVPAEHRVRRLEASAPEDVAAALADALAAGHEGLVLKHPDSGYDAGRRGSAWIKVKPVHTLDLVVLAVEEGSGRRRGWLSNLHLGARDPAGGFVMLGKTFKGLDDQTLQWQTERFTELMTHRDDWTVHVRPEQVVEIAFDGVQRSTRYPGGVALRFARVVRYRDDKTADEVDTIDDVRAFLAPHR